MGPLWHPEEFWCVDTPSKLPYFFFTVVNINVEKYELIDAIIYLMLSYLMAAHVPGIVWASETLLPHLKWTHKVISGIFFSFFLFLGNVSSHFQLSNENTLALR